MIFDIKYFKEVKHNNSFDKTGMWAITIKSDDLSGFNKTGRDDAEYLSEMCYDFYKDWYIVWDCIIFRGDDIPCRKTTFYVDFKYKPTIKPWLTECLESFIQSLTTEEIYF